MKKALLATTVAVLWIVFAPAASQPQCPTHWMIGSGTDGFSGTLDNGDSFGISATSLGDFDGDGIVDLAVGAHRDDDGHTDGGAVWVLFLGGDRTIKTHTKISADKGNFVCLDKAKAHEESCLHEADQFGYSVAAPGDLNGDRIPDLVVGAMGDDDGSRNSGAVWVLFLNSDGTVESHQKISAEAGGLDEKPKKGDSFGISLSAANPDKDGVFDLAVGAGHEDGGGTNRGAVWLLSLSSDGTVKKQQKISPGTGGFTGSLDDHDRFGRSVAFLGDLNDDGVEDLAVGADGDDDGGDNRGAIWVLFLKADGTVKGHQKISSSTGGFRGHLLNQDHLGLSLAVLGDLDRDGVVDLAATTRYRTDRMWLLLLNRDGSVKSHRKLSSSVPDRKDTDDFGRSASLLGDFDTDGKADLAVGVPGDDTGGENRGAVIITSVLAASFDDFSNLMTYLMEPTRVATPYRIVEARNDQPTVAPRHKLQYFNACFFHALGPVVEYLGYAHFTPGAHAYRPLWFSTTDAAKPYAVHHFDVGYHGSVEHLIQQYWNDQLFNRGLAKPPRTDIYSCTEDPNPGGRVDRCFYKNPNAFSAGNKTEINTYGINCATHFTEGDGYGFCAPGNQKANEAWIETVIGGTGSCGTWESPHCGVLWFLKTGLRGMGWHQDIQAGCNDVRSRNEDEDSPFSNDLRRRVLKGFIDHDVPLIASVNKGGHWLLVIGYTDLDTGGLPRTAIAVDSTNGDYHLITDLELDACWEQDCRGSLNSLLPWNHYLDGGCDPGGWAHGLDQQWLPAGNKLCHLEKGAAQCADRTFGVELTCASGDRKASFFVYPGDPFLQIPHKSLSCDTLEVSYADGESWRILSARARRYFYDSRNARWTASAELDPDPERVSSRPLGRGLPGSLSQAVWDSTWPDGGRLSAYDLPAPGRRGRWYRPKWHRRPQPHPMMRTQIELKLGKRDLPAESLPFSDTKTVILEITPPKSKLRTNSSATYGSYLRCLDTAGAEVASYALEPGQGTFESRQFIVVGENTTCAAIELYVNLGQGTEVQNARVSRYRFDPAEDGKWIVDNSWFPDETADMSWLGLSGKTTRFVWDEAWPNSFSLASRGNVDGKTILQLKVNGTWSRSIEVWAYSSGT